MRDSVTCNAYQKNMQLSTELPKNEEGLAILLGGMLNVTSSRALWAIQKSKFTDDQIEEFDDYVTHLKLVLKEENRKFRKNSEGFLETFVLDDNNIIKAHQLVFRKMFHSLVGVRRVLVKFNMYKNLRAKQYRNVDIPNIYANSFIANNTPRSNDIFGMESFPGNVKKLCDNISEYFAILHKAIDDGFQLLKNEKLIKADPFLVQQIYTQFRNQVLDEFLKDMELYEITPSSIATTANPLFERRKQFDDDMSFEQELYHNETPMNVKRYILQKEYCGKVVIDASPEERSLFKDDIAKIKKVRIIIENFNCLAYKPQSGEQIKIDAKSIALFASWCGIPASKGYVRSFYTYFSAKYNMNVDCLKLAGAERVYKAMNKLTIEEKAEFDKKIAYLLFGQEKHKKNEVVS